MAESMKTNFKKYDETKKLAYNVSDLIDDIFNSVEDLCEIVEL